RRTKSKFLKIIGREVHSTSVQELILRFLSLVRSHHVQCMFTPNCAVSQHLVPVPVEAVARFLRKSVGIICHHTKRVSWSEEMTVVIIHISIDHRAELQAFHYVDFDIESTLSTSSLVA